MSAGVLDRRAGPLGLLLLALLCWPCLAEDFEARLRRGVSDLAGVDSAAVVAAIDSLIALPTTQEERRSLAAALTPLLQEEPASDDEETAHTSARRLRSLGALTILDSLGPEGTQGLLAGMRLEDLHVSLDAGRLLARRGMSAFPLVLDEIRREGWRPGWSPANEFFMGLSPRTLQPLGDAARSDASVEVRLAALDYLRRHGLGREHANWALENDPNPRVRSLAAECLVDGYNFGGASRPLGPLPPVLLTALEGDPAPEVRLRVAQLLGGLWRDAEPALPALFAAYRNAEDEEAAEVYLGAFMSIGDSLRRRDRPRWWALFEIEPVPTALLVFLLAVWYLLSPRLLAPLRGPRAQWLAALIAALVPAGLVAGAAQHFLARPWTVVFVPRLFLEIQPSLVLILAFLAALPGWLRVRWRVQSLEPATSSAD